MKLGFDIEIKNGKMVIDGVNYDLRGDNPMQALGTLLNMHLYQRSESLCGTFNRGLYWPDEVQFAVEWALSKQYTMRVTAHAMERIEENDLPPKCYTAALYGEVVEAEVINGAVTKVVTRLSNRRNMRQDICAAIKLQKENGSNVATVLTVWTNNCDDNHKTLKTGNYTQAG